MIKLSPILTNTHTQTQYLVDSSFDNISLKFIRGLLNFSTSNICLFHDSLKAKKYGNVMISPSCFITVLRISICFLWCNILHETILNYYIDYLPFALQVPIHRSASAVSQDFHWLECHSRHTFVQLVLLLNHKIHYFPWLFFQLMFTMNSGREVSLKSANNHVMKAFLFYFCFHNFQWSTLKFQGPGGLQWHMKNPVLQDTHTRKLSRIFSDSSVRFSMSSLSSSSSRWAMSHFCSAFNFKCLWGGKFVTYKN